MLPKFPKCWRRSVSVLSAALFPWEAASRSVFMNSRARKKVLLIIQINHSTCITCITRSCLCAWPPLHVVCQVAESINSLLTFMGGISDFDDLIRKIESVANSARYELDELTERCNASLCLCLPPSLPACLSVVDMPTYFLGFLNSMPTYILGFLNSSSSFSILPSLISDPRASHCKKTFLVSNNELWTLRGRPKCKSTTY